MTVRVKVGSRTVSASGNNAVTGVGFTPKAIVFLWTDPGNGSNVNTTHGFGCTSGTSAQWALFTATNDNFAPPAGFSSAWPDKCMGRTNGITVDWTATLASFDADGFTINFSSNPSFTYFYMAFGGSDITNAKAGVIDVTTAAGNQAVTGVGFQPSALFVGALGQNDFDTGASVNNGNDIINVGFATSTDSYASLYEDLDTSPFQTITGSKTGSVSLLGDSSNAFLRNLGVASLDGDGFTFSKSTPPAVQSTHGYLALRGGRWKAGSETSKTSTPGTRATTGVGFQPRGLFFAGGLRATSAVLNNAAQHCWGGYDGTSAASISSSSDDNVGTSNCASQGSTTNCLQLVNSSNSASVVVAAGSTLDPDGFTLNWTTVDATSREFGYLAVGDGLQVGLAVTHRIGRGAGW